LFGLESIVIYVIFWWLILFITLPFGVSRDKKVIHGNDPGAPKKTLLKKKILITSFASLILTLIFSVVKNEIF
jgi:predicted secreted protein